MSRDRDDERSDYREAPTHEHGRREQGQRGRGEPGRGPPVRGGQGDQRPQEGRQQQGGDQYGGGQQRGGRYQGGQQPRGGQQSGGQQGGGHYDSGQRGGGGGRRQPTQQQPTQRQQQPTRQGQQPPQQQQPAQRRRQPPQNRTPPRQPEQTPSRRGGDQYQQGSGQRAGGQSQQAGGYTQQGQARVSGDWNQSGVASGARPTGGPVSGGREETTGRGTPGIGESGGGTRSIQPRTVDEIMAEDVVTVTGDTPLQDVAAKMATEEVGSIIVVDDDDSPTGIITDRTVALAIDDEGTLAERHVSDVMAGDVVTVTEGTSVFEVTQRLADSGVRRLPVIDGDGALQGIISIDDVVVLLSQELENVSDVLETQSHRF